MRLEDERKINHHGKGVKVKLLLLYLSLQKSPNSMCLKAKIEISCLKFRQSKSSRWGPGLKSGK